MSQLSDFLADAIRNGELISKIVIELVDFDPVLRLPGYGVAECIFCHGMGNGPTSLEVEHLSECLWARAVEARDSVVKMQAEALGSVLG